MIEIQFRRLVNQPTHSNEFRTWERLGYFKTILMAMKCIVHEMNLAHNTNVTVENFKFLHHWSNSEHPRSQVHELVVKGRWQFRFVEKASPDSPWKIGLNDVQNTVS